MPLIFILHPCGSSRALPARHFAAFVNGKTNVSPEMAVRLSKAFGSTAGFWLRLQLNYDLAQIEKRSSKIKVRRVVAPEERPTL
ncbi:MAG: HigA family addiction module antidote protein [Deltaproteobacteria bacterium]|nr:HigA family addiction module antidote protein [Deltaproteobacteria bacterium]